MASDPPVIRLGPVEVYLGEKSGKYPDGNQVMVKGADTLVAFDTPLVLDESEASTAVSIGVAFSRPGDDTEQLLGDGDGLAHRGVGAIMLRPFLHEVGQRGEQRGEALLVRHAQPLAQLFARELLAH